MSPTRRYPLAPGRPATTPSPDELRSQHFRNGNLRSQQAVATKLRSQGHPCQFLRP